MATPAQIVQAIDDAMLTWATDEGLARVVSIQGRSYTRESAAELMQLRKYYQQLVDEEEQTGGTKKPLKMFGVQYGRPT